MTATTDTPPTTAQAATDGPVLTLKGLVVGEKQDMRITAQRAPIQPTEWGPSAGSFRGEAGREAATQLLDLLFAQHGRPDDN